MYYKITNKDSEVYKKLYQLRIDEKRIEKENREAIEKKVGLDWQQYIGMAGQQNFHRCTQYTGFVFQEPEKVDAKIWELSKEYKDAYVPNGKTATGREMKKFLQGLQRSSFHHVLDILNLDTIGKFTIPFVEIIHAHHTIILYLDKNMEPTDENIIEITKKEFDYLHIQS